MAVTASGLYVANFIDILKNDTAIDLAADSLKVALFTNSITPDFDVDTAYSATNEVSGTGYSAGGAALASPSVAAGVAGSLKFDATDSAWTTSTITNARAALIYDTTISNKSIVLVNFGADYSTTAGTFTIVWPAAGIFTIDLTP